MKDTEYTQSGVRVYPPLGGIVFYSDNVILLGSTTKIATQVKDTEGDEPVTWEPGRLVSSIPLNPVESYYMIPVSIIPE